MMPNSTLDKLALDSYGILGLSQWHVITLYQSYLFTYLTSCPQQPVGTLRVGTTSLISVP